MRLTEYTDGFDLALSGKLVLRHRKDSPALYLGAGEPTVRMNHGHFKVKDYLSARVPLTHAEVSASPEGTWSVSFAPDAASPPLLEMRIFPAGDSLANRSVATAGDSSSDSRTGGGVLELEDLTGGKWNRLWVRVPAESGERVWGGGEQLSYFDLRGRHFPLWTSEPGVGRDKTTLITFKADLKDGGGGDYYNTNYPQPTYISSRRYALHVNTTAYSAFDFRHDTFHEIEVWEIPACLEVWSAPHFKDLVSNLSLRFGRQPRLPDWVLQGAIIGLKEGERSFERLETYAAADTAICGLWCEDWVGIRQTSFGRRLFWDWKWNPERYPHLDRRIKDLREKGVRFMGYVNPYLCVDGSLYPQAAAAGYLALKQGSDEPYSVDFGEFFCGIVDFTNPAAANWFADEVIGRNLLDFGLSGWMADFGEYLPTDVRLANGQDGMLAHNEWPVLWAQVNADAVTRRGKTGEAVFFMRAGFSGVQRHCPLLWAGDQSVDFTRHDGLQTVIVAALSSGLLGNAYHHSDIGGYTSLFGNVRTAELIQRWAEMAAFTAVMRSHEGNRPQDNLQIDQDPQVLAHFARMTRIYRHLAPYLRMLSVEAAATGLPLQRPLFLHFEDDPAAYESQTTYLYGADMLVAPVIVAEATTWRVYLPAGVTWVHVWSAKEFAGGAEVEVPAPLGSPPVFYRKDSAFAPLFAGLTHV